MLLPRVVLLALSALPFAAAGHSVDDETPARHSRPSHPAKAVGTDGLTTRSLLDGVTLTGLVAAICIPAIGSEGFPTDLSSSGFTVSASSVRNQKVGVRLYTLPAPVGAPAREVVS
jgi:hypothetical protein